MSPNEIAEAARKKTAKDTALEALMRKEWARVEDAITAHVSVSKKKWKVYEVHHLTQFARLEMLTAFVEGETPDRCAIRAAEKSGIVL